MNYLTICKRAIGTLRRRGVCEWVERDELVAEGCLALCKSRPDAEALAVIIARRAMIDTIRKSERRNRGRVEVRDDRVDVENVDEVSEGDRWDATIYGKQNLRPVNTHPDIWEAMKALPEREYRAVTLSFWGGKTLLEIADELGVSFQRVAQIIEAAKKNMRLALENCGPHAITKVGEEIPVTFSTHQGQANMLLTLAEVSRRLGVSEKTGREIVKGFPAVRVGKRNRYPADAVAAFARTATVPQGPATERTAA
jgi:RNA polymerase sigma factor (sigma-70 family)